MGSYASKIAKEEAMKREIIILLGLVGGVVIGSAIHYGAKALGAQLPVPAILFFTCFVVAEFCVDNA